MANINITNNTQNSTNTCTNEFEEPISGSESSKEITKLTSASLNRRPSLIETSFPAWRSVVHLKDEEELSFDKSSSMKFSETLDDTQPSTENLHRRSSSLIFDVEDITPYTDTETSTDEESPSCASPFSPNSPNYIDSPPTYEQNFITPSYEASKLLSINTNRLKPPKYGSLLPIQIFIKDDKNSKAEMHTLISIKPYEPDVSDKEIQNKYYKYPSLYTCNFEGIDEPITAQLRENDQVYGTFLQIKDWELPRRASLSNHAQSAFNKYIRNIKARKNSLGEVPKQNKKLIKARKDWKHGSHKGFRVKAEELIESIVIDYYGISSTSYNDQRIATERLAQAREIQMIDDLGNLESSTALFASLHNLEI